jgi:hypothetical protein
MFEATFSNGDHDVTFTFDPRDHWRGRGGFSVGASSLAIAQFGMSGPGSQLGMPQYMRAESKSVAQLGDHEGVYVDKSAFNLHLGKPKAIPTAEGAWQGCPPSLQWSDHLRVRQSLPGGRDPGPRIGIGPRASEGSRLTNPDECPGGQAKLLCGMQTDGSPHDVGSKPCASSA